MTLKELVKDYIDEIMDRFSWLVIWKEGRAWKVWAVELDKNDLMIHEDVTHAMQILKKDENAIMINKYRCAHMGSDTAEDIMAGIKFHYDHHSNLLRNRQELGGKLEIVKAANDFLGIYLGDELKNTVYKLEKAIEEGDEREEDIQMAKWEVFKLFLERETGVEYFFSRTDTYFGLCTEDGEIFLLKVDRKEGAEV